MYVISDGFHCCYQIPNYSLEGGGGGGGVAVGGWGGGRGRSQSWTKTLLRHSHFSPSTFKPSIQSRPRPERVLRPPANSLPTACPYLNVLFTDRQNPLLTTHHSTHPALRSIVHSFITNNQPPSRPLKPNPILNRLLPLPLPLPLLHLPSTPSSSPSTNLCNTLASSLTLSPFLPLRLSGTNHPFTP